MKKIVILASIITGAIFVACGNSPKEQQSSDQPQTKKELFSPEEIAYNDSIKDIPMEYTITWEYETIINLDNPSEIEIEKGADNYTLTQKEAYLKAYYSLSFGSRFLVSSRLRFDKFGDKEYFAHKLMMKILNKDGKDIASLIDFPDRRRLEDSVWIKAMNNLIEYGMVGTLEMHRQPIINKGDSMVITISTEPASK